MSQDGPEAVLLDRDGTINVKAPEGSYITSPEQLELLPGAGHAVALLNSASVPVVVVTNQRGIALGLMSEDDLAAVHERLAELLSAYGAWVDEIFFCPHDIGACECRKPGTLLLERARDRLGLPDLARTVMIGDAVSDISAGRKAGSDTVFLGPAEHAPPGVRVQSSLLVAVQGLLATPQAA